jgi:hypothetical protein
VDKVGMEGRMERGESGDGLMGEESGDVVGLSTNPLM